MLELVHQERTNSSIAWKNEIYNHYFAKICNKKVNPEIFGFGIDNAFRIVSLSFQTFSPGIFGVLESSALIPIRGINSTISYPSSNL
jgi:hypothetical protein